MILSKRKKNQQTQTTDLKLKNRHRFHRRRKNKTFKYDPIPMELYKKGSGKKPTKGTLDYKNVALLRQYVTLQGAILPRKFTKLTAKQQRQMATTVKTARIMGLLPFIRP